jgi:hypothetical protein
MSYTQTFTTAAKRLRLGVEGKLVADDLDELSRAVTELVAAAREYFAAIDADDSDREVEAFMRLHGALAGMEGEK